MAAAIIITIIYLIAVAVDFLPKLKKGAKKECWIYGCILVASYALIIAVSFGLMPPSPWQPILQLIKQQIGG